MRKNVKTNNYIVLLFLATLFTPIIFNNKEMIAYTMPLCIIIFIIGMINNLKWVIRGNFLAFRVWRKTGKIPWGGLEDYIYTNKPAEEIEKELIDSDQSKKNHMDKKD